MSSLVTITLTFSVKVGISPISSGRIINCEPHHLLAGRTDISSETLHPTIYQHSIMALALSVPCGTFRENETMTWPQWPSRTHCRVCNWQHAPRTQKDARCLLSLRSNGGDQELWIQSAVALLPNYVQKIELRNGSTCATTGNNGEFVFHQLRVIIHICSFQPNIPWYAFCFMPALNFAVTLRRDEECTHNFDRRT